MLSDKELICLAREGDQKAFTRLLSRHKDSIYFRLLKMVGVGSDAEDLMIEAFDRAFRNIHTYDSTYAFSTWLYSIADNACVDFIRRRKSKTVSIESLNSDNVAVSEEVLNSNDNNPEEDMISEQQSALLLSLLDKLKPKYRELIEMRYFREFAYEEIAKQLSLPVGTVKTRLFRAKAALGELLAEYAMHYRSF